MSTILYISTEHLKPGMILATDLNLSATNNGLANVLTKGQKLSETFITRIAQLHIDGVFIDTGKQTKTIVNEITNETLKVRALGDIRHVFDDFKTKSFVLEENSVKKLSALAQDLVRSILTKKNFTVNLFDLKSYDDHTFHHSLSVAVLSITTGIKLGFTNSMLNDICMGALLHDVGKMMIPKEILNKKGTLTTEEFEIVKQHPQNAVMKLGFTEQISETVLSAIEHHHEKYDGTGYPYGKKKQEIPLYGRIIAICDVYDALISNRPNRKRWFPGDAIEYMMGSAEVHFDQEILTAFLRSVAVYPVGSRVLLSNDKKAIVTKNFSECILRPIVRIVNPDESLDNFVNLFSDSSYTNVTIIGLEHDDVMEHTSW